MSDSNEPTGHGDVTPDVQGRGPSRVWYWVGGGIAVVGVVCAVLWFVLGLMSFANQIDGFQRVPVDGETRQVTLLRTGAYTAYYEARGGNESAASTAGVQAQIVAADGRAVPLSEYDSSLTYDIGGNQGRAVFTFRIDTPGAYEVQASSPGGGEVAIGRGVGRKLVTSIVGAFVIGFLAAAVGATVVIVTAVRRHSARRRGAQPAYPPTT